ncbi:hypothetical protein QYE76_019603 [Lolium multiflorum]|uniref:Trichome birefringence-like C-terminal domain-containing protein n=1 Tax=Lolium multiflorum TaxID=4521 RepID=A0AAD8R496_LOLMU|nr:hypothetical protein QYE76_019603 [Lolium multiflorum]
MQGIGGRSPSVEDLSSSDQTEKSWLDSSPSAMARMLAVWASWFHSGVGSRRGGLDREPVENSQIQKDGIKGTYRVDVDIPADDWVNITKFYDVLIFNTEHWWGPDKFPKGTPLVFYKGGKPIEPPLDIFNGLKVVLKSVASYIEREVPSKTLKLWRTQSPRHFDGGEWDHNGSCMSDRLLEEHELDSWFDPRFSGVNKEARLVNSAIREALVNTDIQLLNLTYMSEFRADAHPAIWLGKKDAVAVWGQDCMHWCLPGVPDTWVDILAARISHYFKQGKG